MKLFKILTYLLSGHNSSKRYGLSTSNYLNIVGFARLPNRKCCLTETVKNTSDETINQSSLLEKERSHSNDFEISHDRKLNIHHGISRIVKRIDLKFLTSRLTIINVNIEQIETREVFKRLDPIYIQNKLPKKLYLPNGSLQLFNIYDRNYYIRRLNGVYIKYT